MISRLGSLGCQAEVGADAAPFVEATRVFEDEHIGQCGQGTHTGDLSQDAGLGIVVLAQLLDGVLETEDAACEIGDGLEDRAELQASAHQARAPDSANESWEQSSWAIGDRRSSQPHGSG